LPILYSNTRRFDFLIAFNRLGLLGESRTSRGLHFLPSACPPSDGGEEGSVVRRSKCGFGQTQWQLPNGYSEGGKVELIAGAKREITAAVTTFHLLIAKRNATFCSLLDNSGQKWNLAEDDLSAYDP
jgi:hypothetical protein